MAKKGRTLKQQLIENYGQQLGIKKLAEYKVKRKFQLSEAYYIKKFGQTLGKEKYKQFREKTKFKIRPQHCARTLESFIQKYGKQLGKQKWNVYRTKQAISNTYQFKKEKYGWTEEQFQQYNKRRAITLKNLIKKYGQTIGTQKYLKYCQKQCYTKSVQYFIDKFGEQLGKLKFQQINKKKSLTKENFIQKFGQPQGLIKWQQYCQKFKDHHSKIADQFFKYISSFNKENHQLFFGKNQKYFSPYFVDFFNKTTNKVIEFYGTYWHADPKIYSQQKIINRKSAKEIWQKDNKRIQFLEKTYNLQIKIIWQDEINNKTLVNQLINWIYLT